MDLDQDQVLIFKIVLIGNVQTGKSKFANRLVHNSFDSQYSHTVGVNLFTKFISIDGKNIKSILWDTAGQQRFRTVINSYYRGANGAIILFDLTKYKTFQDVEKWFEQLKAISEPNIVLMLVGNKSDLSQLREVKQQMIQEYITKNNMIYYETSALTGNGVNEAFSLLMKQIYQKYKQQIHQQGEECS